MSKLSAYLSNERSISKWGSNFCAQVELLIISYIWEETRKSVGKTFKMSTLFYKGLVLLPWLTERLYRLRTGVPVNMLLGVRTEGGSECGVSGVDGAVAL